MNKPRLYPGDLVEVRGPDEIAQTLNGNGALDSLPFMPEMLEFCGRRFQVSRRAVTTCVYGGGSPLGFNADDAVTLNGVRCSGAAHDGCQKLCMIFWREAWLRKIEETATQSKVSLAAVDRLRARLKVMTNPITYYCQASELRKVAHRMSRQERLKNYFNGLKSGNFDVLRMAKSTGIFLFWRIRRLFLGPYPRGRISPTPVESLNLQPGEWVEVKSMPNIIETLNEQGYNRGLKFSSDMRLWCGRRCKVKGRLDKIIMDGTGQLRQLRDTVYLEGSTCGCSYMGFDMEGCPRCEVTYWREIWLRRCEGNTAV
jgi:hypothetical protein